MIRSLNQSIYLGNAVMPNSCASANMIFFY
jgi:hypothetical protein